MKALSAAPIATIDSTLVMSVTADRAERLVAALVEEGLVVREGFRLRLP
jgi:hypothetical protein